MFKVNNKDTRMTSMTSPSSDVSITEFEKVNVCYIENQKNLNTHFFAYCKE